MFKFGDIVVLNPSYRGIAHPVLTDSKGPYVVIKVYRSYEEDYIDVVGSEDASKLVEILASRFKLKSGIVEENFDKIIEKRMISIIKQNPLSSFDEIANVFDRSLPEGKDMLLKLRASGKLKFSLIITDD